MKRAITLIAIITLVFLNWSCDNKTKFQNVKYQSQFELDLPEYMTEMDLENPEAQLQYGSILQDHYVLVIYEDIEELKEFGFDFSIEDYMGFALENVLNTISNSKYERLNEEIQNATGIDYISYKIWGTFDSENIDVYYRLTIFKSEQYFYKLMTWCLADDERIFEPNMDKMVKSFKEL